VTARGIFLTAPNRLSERLSVKVPVGLRADLSNRLDRSGALAVDILEQAGDLGPYPPGPPLSFPRPFREVLEVAIVEARASGHHDHAALLLRELVDRLMDERPLR